MRVSVFVLILVLIAGVTSGPFGRAQAAEVTVSGASGPWFFNDTDLNVSFTYGQEDHAAPAVVELESTLGCAPGDTVAIRYISGTVKAGVSAAWPPVDANGQTDYRADDGNGNTGKGFPSRYMKSYPVYLVALVGTFADSQGRIVGVPFKIGDGPVGLSFPERASRLQLGINDDWFADNSGAFMVDVTCSSTPVPDNGIWKSDDGVSFYIQKYETGACIMVITLDGIHYTSFLDPDYTDGVGVADDVGTQGLSMNLVLNSSTEGTLTADLVDGVGVDTVVRLVFLDMDL